MHNRFNESKDIRITIAVHNPTLEIIMKYEPVTIEEGESIIEKVTKVATEEVGRLARYKHGAKKILIHTYSIHMYYLGSVVIKSTLPA